MSFENNKSYYMPDCILNLFYYNNGLNDNVNGQMRLKTEQKALILLGKYKIKKIDFDENNYFYKIIFYNDNKNIIISGRFKIVNNSILYDKKKNILCKVIEI
jgi:hypothetical protein